MPWTPVTPAPETWTPLGPVSETWAPVSLIAETWDGLLSGENGPLIFPEGHALFVTRPADG